MLLPLTYIFKRKQNYLSVYLFIYLFKLAMDELSLLIIKLMSIAQWLQNIDHFVV